MKKYISLLFCISIFSTVSVKSQDYKELKDVVLTDSISCLQAQTQVLECCNYLLSTPCKQELNSLYASDYVIQWMSKTPNYTFTLHEKFYKAIEGDLLLTSRYYAVLAKVALESTTTLTDDQLQFKAISDFITYCCNTKYKVIPSKKLQKYIDAKKGNTLKDSL